ncbi:flagellar protein FlaG [Paenibacillus sp. 1P03SA]|uniref:flagellar protein FlaG n=1 Tax=Paenibacillus sp. 1P03SA TaxID=3132294 RepID=UPI0039A2DDC1
MKINPGTASTSSTPLFNTISDTLLSDTANENLTPSVNADPQNIQQLVDRVNKALHETDTHIKVKVHEKTNTIMVVVVNNDTDEVIREIPSERMLDLMYNMCVNVGVFLDKKI